jgi:HTH-type transcriptional regulator / antitoxin HigA
MEVLKYKVISSKTQYKEYCNLLENLVFATSKSKNLNDEIALLTLLIEKWDAEHNSFKELDPVKLLQSFMESHQLKAKDLVELLAISKSHVSEILNYRKGFSKVVIRKLATYFKVSQEAFNRPYLLKSIEVNGLNNSHSSKSKKDLVNH